MTCQGTCARVLEKNFSLRVPQIVTQQISRDGTHKWLLRLDDGACVETVYIPDSKGRERGALCVSSQVGCALRCRFCHTGQQGFGRNLRASEIVGQFCVARQGLQKQKKPITTVVFMGMGEPLLNCEAVEQAINVFCDEGGLKFSRRKITVSTAGVAPHIGRVTGTNGGAASDFFTCAARRGSHFFGAAQQKISPQNSYGSRAGSPAGV